MNIQELFDYLKNGLATAIELEEDEIDEAQMLYLEELLKINPYVKSIIISSTNINHAAFVVLFKALTHLEKLNELRIVECNLDYPTDIPLDNFVNKVSVIQFKDIELADSGGSLANLIKYQTNLRELHLSSCNINNNDIRLIAEALSTNHSLESLWLENNNITSEGLCYLFKSLKSNYIIKQLDVCANYANDKYIVPSLADLLQCNTQLNLLFLDTVSVRGIKLLMPSLCANKNLEILSLAIELSELQEALVQLISAKTNIRRLYISSGGMDLTTGNLLASLLEKNYTLVELIINLRKLPKKVQESIESSLNRNRLLFKEKIDTALLMLKAARLVLHAAIKNDNYYAFLPNMPLELLIHILHLIDTKSLLTNTEKDAVIKYAKNRDTLNSDKKNFVSMISESYYSFFPKVASSANISVDNDELNSTINPNSIT